MINGRLDVIVGKEEDGRSKKNLAWNWTRLFQGVSVRLVDLKFQLGTAANLPKYKQEELFKVDLLGSKVLAASS